MSSTITRALFLDILYQTLDNRMFRLLVVLALVLIAPTFLLAFEKEGIDVLFGWQTIGYAGLYQTFNLLPPSANAAEEAIGFAQKVFVDFFAGTLGLLFCIAATAFFLPRALEKGAAENVFAKPVSRGVVLLTRYVAGLLFVGMLSVLLVFGMHLGLLVRSGYSDPGFLWSIVTLVYLFGILHAVSILVGVLTRSSVTALLATMMFFALNGCVQKLWVLRETSEAMVASQRGWTEERGPSVREREPAMRSLMQALEVAHFVLPKTSDAAVLSHKLRKSLEPTPVYEDPATRLRVGALPRGFEGGTGAPDAEGVTWTRPADGDRVSFTLRRLPRHVERGEGKRPRWMSAGSAARERAEAVQAEEGLAEPPEEIELELSDTAWTSSLVWQSATDGATRHREAHYFPASPDWLYVLEVDAPPGALAASPQTDGSVVRSFLAEIEVPGLTDFQTWYQDQVGWTAPLRYNLWLSIGSTLSFVLVLLAIAWWRLARMDF
jgi:ABC-type transport system involved in multi-copper enzyme maturation permease subunit